MTDQPTGPEQEAIRPEQATEQATGQESGQESGRGQAAEHWLPQAPPPGYAAPDVPAGMYYDSTSGLTLPEGTELASHGRRIGAFFLAIPLSIVTLGIGYVIWGLIVWSKGTTPALQVLGMRCWRPEDRKVAGFWWMALREIIGRIGDGILSFITEVISFGLFLARRDRKSLHDLVAGTVVLHDPRKVLPR